MTEDSDQRLSSEDLEDDFLDVYSQGEVAATTKDEDAVSDSGSAAMSMSPTPELSPSPTAPEAGTRSAQPPLTTQDTLRSSTNTAAHDAQAHRFNVPGSLNLWPELWPLICPYLAPDDLCRCLRVSTAFNTRLTGPNCEQIWAASRRTFLSTIPRPMTQMTERSMLNLIGGRVCLNCRSQSSRVDSVTSKWDSGPGAKGLRIIWEFATRLCGSCFEKLAYKDVEVLVSPAKVIHRGLPFAFRTQDRHYVSPTTLPASGGVPPNIQMQKTFFVGQINDLMVEYESARELGSAAVEGWLNGLAAIRKSALADAARWVNWEATLPLGAVPSEILRHLLDPSPTKKVEHTLNEPTSLGNLPFQPILTHPLPRRIIASASELPPPQEPAAPSVATPVQHRPKTRQEVMESKAARRADIEYRCRTELYPPLLPNVLQHMDSFNAAIQIYQPLNDHSWSLLKSRLNEQRDAAEEIEHQRAERLRALQSTVQMRVDEETAKNSAEASIREWETSQGPFRDRLGSYAVEFINSFWRGGDAVTSHNCPNFAAETLVHVRQRYADGDLDGSKLTLDSMKWVFDKYVKPYAERVDRRELFVCSACEDATKLYAFEGLMQHYGAKHTSDFSHGNVIVHWQSAEWPEEDPFLSHPVKSRPSSRGAVSYVPHKSYGTHNQLASHQEALAKLMGAYNQPSADNRPYSMLHGEAEENSSHLRKGNKDRPGKGKRKLNNPNSSSGYGELPEYDSEISEVLPEAADNEYDPRRPAFIASTHHKRRRQGVRLLDNADKHPYGQSDHSHQAIAQQQHPSLQHMDTTNLTADTIAALRQLFSVQQKAAQTDLAPRSRSPSVGLGYSNVPRNHAKHKSRKTRRQAADTARGYGAEDSFEDDNQRVRRASGKRRVSQEVAIELPDVIRTEIDAHASHASDIYAREARYGAQPAAVPHLPAAVHGIQAAQLATEYSIRPDRQYLPQQPNDYIRQPSPPRFYDEYGRPVQLVPVMDDYPRTSTDHSRYGGPGYEFVGSSTYARPEPMTLMPERYPEPVYYQAPVANPSVYGGPRYVYDDDVDVDPRASVPRM